MSSSFHWQRFHQKGQEIDNFDKLEQRLRRKVEKKPNDDLHVYS